MTCASRRSSLGVTLVEMLLALSMFSVMLTAAYLFLDQGIKMWRSVTGSDSSGLELKRVQTHLERDLLQTGFATARLGEVPPSLPAGAPDGLALWFLSAVDPEGQVVHKDGAPFWQRNVLYYLVVPNPHTECPGGAGPTGRDDRCPHKVLIRKVLDTGPTTTPASDYDLTVELPLTNAAPYLTRPNGLNLDAMKSEPGLVSAEVIGRDLLGFEVALSPDPRAPGEIEVSLRDVSIEEARKHLRLGTDSLWDGRFTLQYVFALFPRN